MFTPDDRVVVLEKQGRPLTRKEIFDAEQKLVLEDYKHIAEFLTSKFEDYFVCVVSKRSLFGKLVETWECKYDMNKSSINGLRNKDYRLRDLVDDKKFIKEWNSWMLLYGWKIKRRDYRSMFFADDWNHIRLVQINKNTKKIKELSSGPYR